MIDLATTPLGTRVVVRYMLPDGMATDALGQLTAIDASHCVVDTKRGLQRVPLAQVIAAKVVPPAPESRH